MKCKNIKRGILHVFIIIPFILCSFISGQTISGSVIVNPNTSHTYTYTNPLILSVSWNIISGTKLTSGIKPGGEHYITIRWGSAGEGRIIATQVMNLLAGLTVTIFTPTVTPAVPPMPTITNYPGSTKLTKTGSPPSGVQWYWQSTATGTSTINSNTFINLTSGTKYYLRARHIATNSWSFARVINYTVNPATPPIPAMPTITNYPGYTTLTKTGSPPSGVQWYWQSTATGTSTTNSGITINLTSGTVYYLRARHTSTFLWSSARVINYTVNLAPPAAPPLPSITNHPGYTVLTISGTPPNAVQWYWQSTANAIDTSTEAAASTITLYEGDTYYIRAYNTTTALWSIATIINYTVDARFSNENYIYTVSPQTEATDITVLNNNEKIESINYYDGLGRPMQNIGIRAGGSSEDIITHIAYDTYGRQAKDYLPYPATTTGGLYTTDALTPTTTFYKTPKYENTTNPYSEKHFEASPLNRVLEQGKLIL